MSDHLKQRWRAMTGCTRRRYWLKLAAGLFAVAVWFLPAICDAYPEARALYGSLPEFVKPTALPILLVIDFLSTPAEAVWGASVIAAVSGVTFILFRRRTGIPQTDQPRRSRWKRRAFVPSDKRGIIAERAKRKL